jgi:hypothetical protein
VVVSLGIGGSFLTMCPELAGQANDKKHHLYVKRFIQHNLT